MLENSGSGRRFADRKPVAIVDVGSHSVRLVIYECADRSPTPLFNEKVLCSLGRNLAKTGRLAASSVERALAALRRFRAIADQLGAHDMHVIATAAAREAENGPEFIRQAAEVSRAPVSVLSGLREAELSAFGVVSGFIDPDGIAGDLGGGSLELVDLCGHHLNAAVTLPVGVLRLADAANGSLKAAEALVDEKLQQAGLLKKGKGRTFYAIGGSWRALARLHMEQADYPMSVMHAYRIDANEALAFAQKIRSKPLDDVKGIDTISSQRRELMPYGALVLERLIALAKPSEIVMSGFGIREGLLFELLDEEERGRDPLIVASLDFADLRGRSPLYARELCTWTDALFQGNGPKETANELRLRHAACLLSDIAWRSHPDYRGTHSVNMIAHADFAGLDHPARAFMSLAVYYRHEGLVKESLSPRLIDLVDKRALERARIIGAALRVAHVVSVAMPGVLGRTPLSFGDGTLVIDLPSDLADLEGERVARRMGTLAGVLGREAVVRVERKRLHQARQDSAA